MCYSALRGLGPESSVPELYRALLPALLPAPRPASCGGGRRPRAAGRPFLRLERVIRRSLFDLRCIGSGAIGSTFYFLASIFEFRFSWQLSLDHLSQHLIHARFLALVVIFGNRPGLPPQLQPKNLVLQRFQGHRHL